MRASAVPAALLTAALACLSAPLWAQALDHGALQAAPAVGTGTPCLAQLAPLPADLRAPACLLVRSLDVAGAAGAAIPRGPGVVARRLR